MALPRLRKRRNDSGRGARVQRQRPASPPRCWSSAPSPAATPVPALAALAGSVLLGGGYLVIAVLTPAGVGMGDVRLAALTGGLAAATGWDTVLLATALPYVIGLPFTIAKYRRARRGGGDRHVPFGPLLAAGAVTAAIITG